MKVYRAKTKMFGYKVGIRSDDFYVAVPKKYFDGPGMDGTVQVTLDGKQKVYTVADKASEALQHGPYSDFVLYYFLWEN